MPEPLRLTVLREILRYVRSFRDRVFVIALDGDLLESRAALALCTDVALLHSVNIQPVLVVDISFHLSHEAARRGITAPAPDAQGPVPWDVLQLAHEVAGSVSGRLLNHLTRVDLPAAVCPAIVAHPAGIRRGVDWLYAGRIDRVEGNLLQRLIQNRIVPIVLPLGYDGEGHSYLIHADPVAAEVAIALQAEKLLYVTTVEGLEVDGQLVRQLKLEDAIKLLDSSRIRPEKLARKVRLACRACQAGVERVHLVSGLLEAGLLGEVFSAEGTGTLIHRDEYAAIRQATSRDAPEILRLIEPAMENEELLPRTLEEIQSSIHQFLVYDLDGTITGCVAVIPYPETGQAELACLAVDPNHENRGIGRRLVQKALERARELGAAEVFVLTTQAINYFRDKLGFIEAEPSRLPATRRRQWEESGRNSRVLVKPTLPVPHCE